MPFIEDKKRRKELDEVISVMSKVGINSDGDLNYLLYKWCKYFVQESYNSYKNFLGELRECECQCRNDFLVPYEKRKEEENGTV